MLVGVVGRRLVRLPAVLYQSLVLIELLRVQLRVRIQRRGRRRLLGGHQWPAVVVLRCGKDVGRVVVGLTLGVVEWEVRVVLIQRMIIRRLGDPIIVVATAARDLRGGRVRLLVLDGVALTRRGLCRTGRRGRGGRFGSSGGELLEVALMLFQLLLVLLLVVTVELLLMLVVLVVVVLRRRDLLLVYVVVVVRPATLK